MLSKQIWSAIGYGLLLGFTGLLAGIFVVGPIVVIIMWFLTGVGDDLVYEEYVFGRPIRLSIYAYVYVYGLIGTTIIGIIYGIICGFNKPVSEEVERRREEAERRREKEEAERRQKAERRREEAARLQRHKEEQEGYYKQMVSLCEQSLAIFESMPGYLDIAEKYLNQAEANFAEGAFAPFWDSVENAAKWLAYFNKDVRQIKDKLSHYNELIGKYEGMPPRFSLAPQSVKKLGVSTATAERMEIIVRAAQRNFQFAMIYEQRKTNQILVAGFKTLAEALEQMTWKITASLDDLAVSVNTSLRAIDSRLDKNAAMSKQHHYEMIEQVSEVVEREREVVKKLDNIQEREREVVKKLDNIQHRR